MINDIKIPVSEWRTDAANSNIIFATLAGGLIQAVITKFPDEELIQEDIWWWTATVNQQALHGMYRTESEATEAVSKFVYHRLRSGVLTMFGIPKREQKACKICVKRELPESY